MAALSMTAFGQAKDPATYEAHDGYQLENLWMMSIGNGENGVAQQDWTNLTAKMGNVAKATTAAILGDYVYISCSTAHVPSIDENGQPFESLTDNGHLLVLDRYTGAFVKDLALTVNGEPYYGLLCANQVGHDDGGNLWVCGYKDPIWNDDTQSGKSMDLYVVDTETGAMTLVNAFAMDEVEGPSAGKRVDYFDVMGDLVDMEKGAAFMAIPNDIPGVIAWVRYSGTEEWDQTQEGCNVVICKETYPAGQTSWNYSPMGSFVRPFEEYEDGSLMLWVDGHTTNPTLYDTTGELLSSFKDHAGDAPTETEPEGGPWANYLPERQANGMRQFRLGETEFLAYAVQFPNDKDMGGHVAIVKLDVNLTLEQATPMWLAPEGKMGVRKGEGRFSHAIDVTDEITDANGKVARELLVFKDMNGVALYRIAEAGFEAGVNDIVADLDANAPVEYFNLNGVRMSGELAPGLYITRQGSTVNKVVVK